MDYSRLYIPREKVAGRLGVGREGEARRRAVNNTFSSWFARTRSPVTKENRPCPATVSSFIRCSVAFSNIMKSVTCEKFKIQPSFPLLSHGFSSALSLGGPNVHETKEIGEEKGEIRRRRESGIRLRSLVDDGATHNR